MAYLKYYNPDDVEFSTEDTIKSMESTCDALNRTDLKVRVICTLGEKVIIDNDYDSEDSDIEGLVCQYMSRIKGHIEYLKTKVK